MILKRFNHHLPVCHRFMLILVHITGISLYGIPSQVLAQAVPPTVPLMTRQPFNPLMIKGISLNPQNSLTLDFIIDTGDEEIDGKFTQEKSLKLIKYFLAALTTPEDKMWVNLSPNEKDRMIPREFGFTEMGHDLLVQDFLLKQLSASLTHPEDLRGKKFWEKIYAQVHEKYGVQDIPLNNFYKVWIVPDKAVVYENGRYVFVLESRLKVLMEEDYQAGQKSVGKMGKAATFAAIEEQKAKEDLMTSVYREVLIPEIEKEINEGPTFANLRQMYQAMILAAWYKQNLEESLLGREYANQNKTQGIQINGRPVNEAIYTKYMEAFKTGVYDFIKEDYDQVAHQLVPRRYFSGGITAVAIPQELQTRTQMNQEDIVKLSRARGRHAAIHVDFSLLANSELEVGRLIQKLNKLGIKPKILGIDLLDFANDREDLRNFIQRNSVIKNMDDIRRILLWRLNSAEMEGTRQPGKPLSGIDPRMAESLYNAIFDQKELLAQYTKKAPLKVAVFRRGQASDRFTSKLKSLENINIKIIPIGTENGWNPASFRMWPVPSPGFQRQGNTVNTLTLAPLSKRP